MTVTPSFVSPESSSSAEQRLLVSGVADLRGARILVSGVEEIDTSSGDPIVHLSPPYLEVEPSSGELLIFSTPLTRVLAPRRSATPLTRSRCSVVVDSLLSGSSEDRTY